MSKISRRVFLSQVGGVGLASFLVPQSLLALDEDRRWVERMRPLMGTFVAVAVYWPSARDAESIIDDTFRYIEALILSISNWRTDSDTSRLAKERKVTADSLSKDFIELITLAKKIEQASDRAYSPLCQRLSHLWRAARAAETLPHPSDQAAALAAVQSAQCNIGHEIELFGEESFDFGGIGKGFVADKACEYLRSRGVGFARVAASGDIAFLGETEWSVEIEHPRKEGKIFQNIALRGSHGIATSGDYRSCWFVNGKRYHHLIDPRTGRPSEHCAQVTVMHRSAAVADGLATAAFFMPPDKALRFLQSYQARGIIIDRDGRCVASSV